MQRTNPLVKITKQIEELVTLLPEALVEKIKNLTAIITDMESAIDNHENLEDELLQAYRKELKLNESATQQEILTAAKKASENLVKNNSYKKTIAETIKRINSIIVQLKDVIPNQAKTDYDKFNVQRRNGESIANYITRISAQANAAETEQKQVEKLFMDFQNYFQNMYGAIHQAEMPGLNKEFWGQQEGTNYQEMMQVLAERYNNYNAKIDELKKQATDELKKLSPRKPNTITVYVWYMKGVVPGSRKMFGMDSTGHIGIDVNGTYLSFYPHRRDNVKPSFLARIAKKIGVPSPDAANGYFGPYEEDLYRRHISTDKLSYWQCETIELDCTDGKIDLKAAEAYAKSLLENPVDYKFYTKNCSTIGVEVLEAAGAGKFLPFPMKFGKLPDSPGEVRNYARALKAKLEEAQVTDTVSVHTTYKQRIGKRLAYIKTKLEEDLLAAEGNHDPYNSMTDENNKELAKKLLSEAINKINEIENEIKEANDIKTLNEKLNQDKITKAITAVLNYNNLPDTTFKVEFVREHITPLFSTLKIFLPSAIYSNVNAIVNTLKRNFAVAETNALQAIPRENLSIPQLIQEEQNMLLQLNKLIDNYLTENPRQATLTMSKVLDFVNKLYFNDDLQAKISHCDYIYEQNVKQLASKINDKAQAKELMETLLTNNEGRQLTHDALKEKLENYKQDNQSLVDKILANYLDKNAIDAIDNFATAYADAVQTAVGAFNQYLYFDAHTAYQAEDGDNVMSRLNVVLGIDPNQNKNINDLIDMSVAKLKKENAKTLYDKASQGIYSVLSTSNKNYNERKLAIQVQISKALAWTIHIPNRRKLDELKFEALIIAANQGFMYGHLNKDEFLHELKEAAKVTHDKVKKKQLDRFIESFELQSYLDDIAPETSQKFADVKEFSFYDEANKAYVSSDNPIEFSDQLPTTDQEVLSHSSLRILMTIVGDMTDHPLFTIAMKPYGNVTWNDFNQALIAGFNENGKDKANKKLNGIYKTIKMKEISKLSEGEKLFCDIYDHINVATKLLEKELSVEQRMGLLSRISLNRMTRPNDIFFSKLSDLYNAVRSAGNLRNLADEVVLYEVKQMLQNVSKEKNNIILNLESNGIAKHYEQHQDKSADPQLLPKNLTDRELLPTLMKYAESNPLGYHGQYLDNLCRERPDVAAMTLVLKTEGIIENAKSKMIAHTPFNDDIVELRKNLKDQLVLLQNTNVVDTPDNLITKETFDKAKEAMISNLDQAIGTLNRLVFLEDTKIKKLLAEFLDIPNYKEKTINSILHEASVDAAEVAIKKGYDPRQHYKIKLVDIIQDFAIGYIDEKTFYHKLFSYIEDNSPRISVPGFNWLYDCFFENEVGHKYYQMPHLEKMKKAFLNKFAQLESDRLGNVELAYKNMQQPEPVSNRLNGSSQIGNASNDERPKNHFDEYLSESAAKAAHGKEQSKLKRLQTKVYSKMHNFFSKKTKAEKFDNVKKIKLNVKYDHYEQRKTELDNSPLLKNSK